MVTTGILFIRAVRRAHTEDQWYEQMAIDGINPGVFQGNCLRYGLTKTEIVNVEFLYKGLSNKEIVGQLFNSEETIKKHIQNIFHKTGVKKRTALVNILQNSQLD